MRHFCAVKDVLTTYMEYIRDIEMTSLEGYAELLRVEGHYVKLLMYDAREMRKVRNKAAEFIFRLCNKEGLVWDDETFDNAVVYLSNMQDGSNYYGGFVFVPSTSGHLCRTGRKYASVDASHRQRVGSQFYGTTFEAAVNYANNNLVPVCFSHSVMTKSEETWTHVFEAAQYIDG